MPEPKTPPKRKVTCPHCGQEQMEYAQARTTFCRSCGRHYEIGATPTKAENLLAHPAKLPPKQQSEAGWFSKFLPHKKPTEVSCFDCGTTQTVQATARSTNCRRCGAYVDLQDIKVMSPFSRNFRTHGHLTIGPKGVCNSVRAECGSARIEGELGGNLTCSGDLELRSKGRILGSIKARRLLVHKKAEVQFGRAIRAVDVEIEGSLTADIQAEGTVRLKRSGRLQGSVTAKSFIIENGAVFDGKVTISPPDMPGLHSLLLADGTLHRARPTTASTSGRSQQAPPGETLELPLGE